MMRILRMHMRKDMIEIEEFNARYALDCTRNVYVMVLIQISVIRSTSSCDVPSIT